MFRDSVLLRLSVILVVVAAVLFAGCCCCTPGPTDYCGDGVCDSWEDSSSCPEDCGTVIFPTPTPLPQYTPSTTPLNLTEAKWTVMVYLDGDNNLEGYGLDDFNEMEAVGSTSDVNIIVQMDRTEYMDWLFGGDWSETRRFRVEKDYDTDTITTLHVQSLGEKNMGDPETLIDFADWTMTNYPAEHYALIIWDHGAGWPIVAIDDDNGEDGITMDELSYALGEIKEKNNDEKLDIIGFDACLMAMLEVAYQVQPYADVMVSSEESEPADGWDYTPFLQALSADPDMGSHELATRITESYLDYYQVVNKDESVTLSAVDLNKLDKLTTSVDAFSLALVDAMPEEGNWRQMAQATTYSEKYGGDYYGYLDLKDFANMVSYFTNESSVKQAALNVSMAVDEVVISNVHGTEHKYSHGLSIDATEYAAVQSSDYPDLEFSRANSWSSFLRQYYGVKEERQEEIAMGAPGGIEKVEMDVSDEIVSYDYPIEIAANVSGTDIKEVDLMVFQEVMDSSGEPWYLLIDYAEFDAPVYQLEDGSTVDYWVDGNNEFYADWDATGLATVDDEGYVFTPLLPEGRGSDLYFVDGTYTVNATGEQFEGSLVFSGDSGELKYIWNYDEVSEVIPEKGDTFSALTLGFDLEEDSDIFDVEYEELVYGEEGWYIDWYLLEDGYYILAIYAEDFYDNSEVDFEYVYVANEEPW